MLSIPVRLEVSNLIIGIRVRGLFGFPSSDLGVVRGFLLCSWLPGIGLRSRGDDSLIFQDPNVVFEGHVAFDQTRQLGLVQLELLPDHIDRLFFVPMGALRTHYSLTAVLKPGEAVPTVTYLES